jgi:hypothetical protein
MENEAKAGPQQNEPNPGDAPYWLTRPRRFGDPEPPAEPQP